MKRLESILGLARDDICPEYIPVEGVGAGVARQVESFIVDRKGTALAVYKRNMFVEFSIG